MTDSVIQRFQALIDTLVQGNRSEFARLTGKTPSHITDICKGRTSLTMQYLITLRTQFNVNLHWLLLGEGNMVGSESDHNDEFVHVPLYDVQASAGYGNLIHSEQVVDHLAFKKSWVSNDLRVGVTELALVTVEGDSMFPTLENGDLILVDLSQNEVNREGIYLIQFEGGLMAKRLQKDYEQNLHVISDNHRYKELIITPDAGHPVQVVGKVVWFGRRT